MTSRSLSETTVCFVMCLYLDLFSIQCIECLVLSLESLCPGRITGEIHSNLSISFNYSFTFVYYRDLSKRKHVDTTQYTCTFTLFFI